MNAHPDRPAGLNPKHSLDLLELRRTLDGWLQQGWLPERELCVGWFGLPSPDLDADGRLPLALRLPGLRLALPAPAGAAEPGAERPPAPPPGLLLAHTAVQDSELALLDLLITSDAGIARRACALARPIWWIDQEEPQPPDPATFQPQPLRRFPAGQSWPELAAAVAMWASSHSAASRPLAGCLDEQQAVVSAIATYQQGDSRNAAIAARNLLVGAPLRSDLWQLLGLIAQQAGDLPQARDCFSHVTRLTPGYVEGWRCLSLCCLAQGVPGDALLALQHALSLAPGDAGLRALHARILQSMGMTQLAATEADNALALAPNDLNALLACARSAQVLGQHNRAIALYLEGLPQHPTSLELQFRLGQALGRVGRSDEALLHLAHVIEATGPGQPLHRQALLQLIDAQTDCGALQPAAASARQALALDRGDLDALRRSVALERRTGSPARALAALQSAAQLRTELPEDLQLAHALLHRETGSHLLGPTPPDAEPAQPGNPWRLLDGLHQLARCPTWQDRCRRTADSGWSAAKALSLPQPRSTTSSATSSATSSTAKSTTPKRRPARLRVAYLVGESHAAQRLRWAQTIAAAHDSQRIEAWTGHWGALHGRRPDPTERADETSHQHIDLTGWPEQQAAQHLADLDIDILVDLEGCGIGQREGILLRRPARCQLSWKHLNGPLAPPCYDVLLADRLDDPAIPIQEGAPIPRPWPLAHAWTLIPPLTRQRRLDRTHFGLPLRAPVLTCAAEPQWLDGQMLQIWMSLLQAVPTAALWLPDWPPPVRQALRERAQAAGVAAQRLLHMPRELTDLQAALTLADLHLAPGPQGGETALAIALSAAIPALACGDRTAPTLLRDAGLPSDHHCPDLATFQTRALTLLRRPRELLAQRRQLADTSRTPVLFDLQRQARQLEAIYSELLERPSQPLGNTTLASASAP